MVAWLRNDGATDVAPTIAAPGLIETDEPSIADGAPTISADVTATTATANATMERWRVAGRRFGAGGV
jgi:hypothetical protein